MHWLRTLAFIALLAIPTTTYAQIPVRQVDVAAEVTGTMSGDAESVEIDVNGRAGVGIQVTGAWDMTISFQASIDGSTWVALNAFPSNSATAATSTSGGTNGVWFASVAADKVRVLSSGYSSGTATINLYASMSSSGSGGGGGGGTTQYLEDAIHNSGDTGTMFLAVRQDSQVDLAADGDYIPVTVDGSGNLRVTNATGGLQVLDDADWTADTSPFTPAGGRYESTPSSCTDGDQCTALIDSTGRFLVVVDDFGTSAVAASSPCGGSTVATTLASGATATTTTLVAEAASEVVYVCALSITAEGDQLFTLEYGTGADCGTGTTNEGQWSLTSAGGVVLNGGGAHLFNTAASDDLCITTDAAVQYYVTLTYVQQ